MACEHGVSREARCYQCEDIAAAEMALRVREPRAIAASVVCVDPKLVDIAAAAIANARGGRRGAPAISNVLEILPPKLLDEVRDDARAVLKTLAEHHVSIK